MRTLRLLITSKKTNEPISSQILHHVELHIGLFFRPGGPHERGETLSIIRRLLIRLRGGSSSLDKTAPSSPSSLKLLEVQKHFVQTLIDYVAYELSPNASYQRRVMGLTVLRYLLDSRLDACDRDPIQRIDESELVNTHRSASNRGADKASNDPDWPFSICLRHSNYSRNLLSLLSDAYEDVRILSESILRHLLIPGLWGSRSQLFSDELHAAMEISLPKVVSQAAQTNRSDHADGLGRLYALLHFTPYGIYTVLESPNSDKDAVLSSLFTRLERVLSETSTFDMPGSEPLHSLLLGATHCMTKDGIPTYHERVITICRQVWKAVADRLCVDSPENTDEDADDLEGLVAGPKDMLSYSWRALRDSR